jgi:ribosomal-protein-alanine acetyltransferase
MDGVEIREMTAGDLVAVMAIAGALEHAPDWPPTAYEAALDALRLPKRVTLVAETADGTVAGFAVAAVFAPESELESIAVARNQQRRGVARRLLAELTAELRGCGVSELHLEVRASNQRARSFYSALGFAETGRRPSYYAAPLEDAVVYRLTL